jgi:hypothetical protein
MPEAIATSKRKFHKLLDSITTASNTSQQRDNASGGANANTTLTPREKLELASERARKRLRASTSSTSLSTTLRPSYNRITNTSTISLPRNMSSPKLASDEANDDKHIPNFAPWSQETFLARMKTFSKVSDWHPKPEVINEVHWAKRGWSCVDVNTVACKGGCERRVVVKLSTMGKKKSLAKEAEASAAVDNAEDDEEVDEAELEQALAERYQDEIVNGHSKTCLWRKGACKDDIYRLSLVRPIVWKSQLHDAYISLLSVAQSIKDIAIKSAVNADSSFLAYERLASELPTDVIPSSDAEESLKSRILEIALHGWRGSIEHRTELLNCETCFQRVGLWLFQPGYRPGKTNNTSTEDDDPEDDGGDMRVDMVGMHREHCPWRNPASQKATGSLAGLNACQIFHRVVSTWTKEQRRKSTEQQEVVKDAEDAESAGSFEVERPKLSREEIERQDKERESKLRKLKKMFTVKRSSKVIDDPKASS